MTKRILVLFALLASTPALGQEVLPLRSHLGEVTIDVTDGKGDSVRRASILLTGPTHREALTSPHGQVTFTDLPPGQYRVTIRTDDFFESHHTMTILGGVRYDALWMVGPSPAPKEPPAPPVSFLGPLSVSQVSSDPRWVRYVSANRNHLLMFWKVEIARVFPDGSAGIDIRIEQPIQSRQQERARWQQPRPT